ncbi:hypothetical protein L596_014707 [Steinernema carpocapsae]|uniref:Uncharacterized protein n=1 Tax=Steinernema carpocapsae TaxID=34508 RepID=A0A4U5NCP1_STECR|nr:hypothetical protein L596_014707 [Steinernema carpocapsae]
MLIRATANRIKQFPLFSSGIEEPHIALINQRELRRSKKPLEMITTRDTVGGGWMIDEAISISACKRNDVRILMRLELWQQRNEKMVKDDDEEETRNFQLFWFGNGVGVTVGILPTGRKRETEIQDRWKNGFVLNPDTGKSHAGEPVKAKFNAASNVRRHCIQRVVNRPF